MLKFIIVGLILTTVSSAPLESTLSEKSNDSHSHTEHGLVRPSPINPDIPMDPKPAERIILDDSKSESRDQKSLNDKPSSDDHPHDHPESLKSELSKTESSSDNNQEKKLIDEKVSVKSDDKQSDDNKKNVRIEYNHDDKKSESDAAVASAKSNVKTGAKEYIEPVKSGEPTIVYAVKADEKLRSESFQTSHRIPSVEEGERKFQTGHHIPAHIDAERIKLIENAKVAEKPLN